MAFDRFVPLDLHLEHMDQLPRRSRANALHDNKKGGGGGAKNVPGNSADRGNCQRDPRREANNRGLQDARGETGRVGHDQQARHRNNREQQPEPVQRLGQWPRHHRPDETDAIKDALDTDEQPQVELALTKLAPEMVKVMADQLIDGDMVRPMTNTL